MAAHFPRFLTIEEAAQLLGVSPERISMWIGECKLPVAARSEYAGFLLRALTVATVGRDLADTLPPDARRYASTGHQVERLVPPFPPASGDPTHAAAT